MVARSSGQGVLHWRGVVAVTVLSLVVGLLVSTSGAPPAGAAVEGDTTITSPRPASAMIGVPYAHQFTADRPGAHWAVSDGTLPTGLELDPATGLLSGTPITEGTWTATVTAVWNVEDGLVAGSEHTCRLNGAGQADCWGNNDYGQAEDQPGPYTTLAANGHHTCALTTAGAADCWGDNETGQAEDQPGPYTALAPGVLHTCALTTSGAADCWGNNALGQAEDQPGPYTALGAGFTYTCGLTPAGSVDCWGDNSLGQATDQPGPYTTLTAGSAHTCALTPTGAADCWGNNPDGRADDQPGPYTTIAAGGDHTCAQAPGGTVDCWGKNTQGQATDQPGAFSALTVGGEHTCGLTPTGAVSCTGLGNYGQANAQTGPYTAITAGRFHTCGLTPTGAADCWGRNSAGESTDRPGPYTALAAGSFHNCALTPAGAADCWGDDSNGQATDQPGPYTALAAGAYHTCGLTPDGAADCWGWENFFGQADGQPGPYTALVAGSSHTCGLTPAGAADCWGYDALGQADDQPGPYTAITAGYYHTCGLTPTGAADCWGDNSDGQITEQPGRYTALAAGLTHTCGLTPTAGVDCWGNNDYGQTDGRFGPLLGHDAQTFSITIEPPAGLLRVTTNPAVPGAVIVDGVARDSWGLNWVTIATGGHEICFGPVPGFTTPPCQDVTVLNGQTTNVVGDYTARGTLRVLTSPALPSTIIVDGIPRNDWGLWTDLDPGTYEVCFGNVSDWEPPECQNAVVTAGGNTTITGEFEPSPGAPSPGGSFGFLRATTNPAVASRISIDGHWRDTWGLTWLKIPTGTHEVCFEPVLYTDGPDCQNVNVTAGITTTVEGIFTPHGFLRVITDPAVGATILVDGLPANAWGVWTSKPAGTHEVCFGPVAALTQPLCQDAAVTAGQTTTITGTYT